jgi:uncharacterized lipoprotein
MKLIFSLALLLISTASICQNKKDTKIIITPKDTSAVFKNVVLAFFERGYTADQQSEEMGIFSTKQRELKNDASTLVRFRAQIKDGKIIITGDAALNGKIELFGVESEIMFFEIYFGGAKKSGLRNAWNEMDLIAKSLGEVSYAK